MDYYRSLYSILVWIKGAARVVGLISFVETTMIKQLFIFQGRAGRQQFWVAMIVAFVAAAIGSATIESKDDSAEIFGSVLLVPDRLLLRGRM